MKLSCTATIHPSRQRRLQPVQGGETVTVSVFVDDTMVFRCSRAEIKGVRHLLEVFECLSGLKPQPSKCQYICLNRQAQRLPDVSARRCRESQSKHKRCAEPPSGCSGPRYLPSLLEATDANRRTSMLREEILEWEERRPSWEAGAAAKIRLLENLADLHWNPDATARVELMTKWNDEEQPIAIEMKNFWPTFE
ncbi:hypothetical protein PybrP1_005079 [[Pythium] brassicae (nom. inval.)]|nr:hypothetical protein PybrP1_005079 [[Pythium] brassicae (nom. inval.)]